jgi:hypothetical protein
MYEADQRFRLPSRDTTIWRYVDLAKFLAMLETESLHFPAIGVLAPGDQWEAAFPKGLNEVLADHMRGTSGNVSVIVRRKRQLLAHQLVTIESIAKEFKRSIKSVCDLLDDWYAARGEKRPDGRSQKRRHAS